MCTALSATIGTGNIVGVGTAIIAGGPGAVFWMWITGVFGIATKYSETFAAVKYRVKDHNGDMLGGAMYAWKRGFTDKDGKTPWWALLGAGAFALFAAIASFGIGSAVQSSAMTEVISTNLPGVPAWGIGLAIVIMVSVVIFGGVKVISNVCEKLVPFMAIAYIWGCVVILGMNWEFVWPALCLIVESAFTAKAAFGGALGQRPHAGAAVRLRARPVLQRVGPGLGAHRGLGGLHAQSGAPGARVHDRHLLGHRHHLPAHRSRARVHHARQRRSERRGHGRRHQRRRCSCPARPSRASPTSARPSSSSA